MDMIKNVFMISLLINVCPFSTTINGAEHGIYIQR